MSRHTIRMAHNYGRPELTEEQVEDIADGRLLVVGPTVTILGNLSPRQLAIYREAEASGVITVTGQRDLAAENLYWALCKAIDRPFVRLRLRGRDAHVTADAWPRRADFAEAVGPEIKAVIERNAKRGTRYGVGRVLCYADNLPRERGPDVAASFWAIVTAPRVEFVPTA